MKTNSYILILTLFSFSCTKVNTQDQKTTGTQWYNEYTMLSSDSSFFMTIDVAPQDEEYENGIFRLGLKPLKSHVVDTMFCTNMLEKMKYFYGAVSVQGSMHNHWYVFAYSERIGDGMFVFNSCDYTLKFPNEYVPFDLANRYIEMHPIKNENH